MSIVTLGLASRLGGRRSDESEGDGFGKGRVRPSLGPFPLKRELTRLGRPPTTCAILLLALAKGARPRL